jgi:hypothetical protein
MSDTHRKTQARLLQFLLWDASNEQKRFQTVEDFANYGAGLGYDDAACRAAWESLGPVVSKVLN